MLFCFQPTHLYLCEWPKFGPRPLVEPVIDSKCKAVGLQVTKRTRPIISQWPSLFLVNHKERVTKCTIPQTYQSAQRNSQKIHIQYFSSQCELHVWQLFAVYSTWNSNEYFTVSLTFIFIFIFISTSYSITLHTTSCFLWVPVNQRLPITKHLSCNSCRI